MAPVHSSNRSDFRELGIEFADPVIVASGETSGAIEKSAKKSANVSGKRFSRSVSS
jgi:hypothetical protein